MVGSKMKVLILSSLCPEIDRNRLRFSIMGLKIPEYASCNIIVNVKVIAAN